MSGEWLLIFCAAGVALWVGTRPRREWFDGVGRPAAYRLISQKPVIRERDR